MINSNITKLITLIGSFLFWGSVIAQNTLSLTEALSKAMSNNSQIKIADYEHQSALSDVDKMKSIYLPQVEATATGSLTNIPLHAFGTKLQQGRITQSDFNPSSLNEPSAISNLNTQILVKQPLINIDAKATRKAVVAKSRAINQQAVRTKNVIRNEVMQAYLQLQLVHELRDVLMQAKQTAEANLKLANDNLEAGYLQRADVLAVEVRINEIENQLFQADNNILNISDQLSFFMGSEMGQEYTPNNKLKYNEEDQIFTRELSMTRSDLSSMKIQVDAQKHLVEAAEKINLPRLNAFGSYELNNNLDFGDSQHGYMIGLQASWQIFNGYKNKGNLGKAKVELNKSQEELIHMIAREKLALSIVKRKISEAKNKISLAKKSIEQSKESLRIKTNRFAEGLEKTTEILIAETTVSQKEMDYVEAVYQYQSAYADLLFMLEQD